MKTVKGVYGKNCRRVVHYTDGTTISHARLLAQVKIGRPLERLEVAHHINGDPTDDRLENIEVMWRTTHANLHRRTWVEQLKAQVLRELREDGVAA